MGNLVRHKEAQMQRLLPYFPISRSPARMDDRPNPRGFISVNGTSLRWCDAPAERGSPMPL